MGRRRDKKTTAKQAPLSPGVDLNDEEVKEPQKEKQGAQFTDPDGIMLFCNCFHGLNLHLRIFSISHLFVIWGFF